MDTFVTYLGVSIAWCYISQLHIELLEWTESVALPPPEGT